MPTEQDRRAAADRLRLRAARRAGLTALPEAGTLLANDNGQSFPSEGSFANALKREVRRLGLNDELSFHGLRYAAAARLEEAGASLGSILALLGHRTFSNGDAICDKKTWHCGGCSVTGRRRTQEESENFPRI